MHDYAIHVRVLQGLEHVRVRAEGIGTTVSRQLVAAARTISEGCDAFSRARTDALRLVSAAQPFWKHDLLMAALVVRGHVIDPGSGDTPHLVIDGVHATFEEAVAFHRGVVTLADIEDRGALNDHAPDCVASGPDATRVAVMSAESPAL